MRLQSADHHRRRGSITVLTTNDKHQNDLVTAVRAFLQKRPEPIAISNQGAIYRMEFKDQALALKTLPPGSRLNLIHRLTLEREYRAYQRLQSVQCFVCCHGLIDRSCLVLDWVDGQPIEKLPMPVDHPAFDALLDSIEAMHRQGVVHCDLKRKSNILIDRDEQPVILDLGACFLHKPGLHPLNHRLFKLMKQIDLNSWVKLKYGGYTGLSQHDQAYLRRTWIERILSHIRSR